MNAGSLFSGIGGMDEGLRRAGFHHVFFAEADPYRRAVLAARWPGAIVYDDVRAVHPQRRRDLQAVANGGGADAAERERDIRDDTALDLLAGGFPCQDLSVAGQRRGLAGDRSGLFFEFARIIDALRPRWLLVENVPGLFSSNGGRDFGVVLGTLADLGYGVGWRVLDSRFFGVPQRRRRVFIVGARVDGDPRAAAERAGQVLAVGSRCGRHPATRGEAREDAPVASLSGLGNGGPDDNDGQAGRVIAFAGHGEGEARVANALKVPSHGASWSGGSSDTFVAATLKSQRGKAGGGLGPEETLIADTLTSGSHPNSNAPGRRREDDINLVAGPLGGENDGVGRRTEDDPNLVYPISGDALRAGDALTPSADAEGRIRLRDPGLGIGEAGAPAFTPTKTHPGAVAAGASVRRLTPTECERLQGLSDGWTQLGRTPDSRRYAALGDAVTANVAFWIGTRLIAASPDGGAHP